MDDDQKLAENDHRRLGQELQLFFISSDVGSGLPLLMPRGEIIKYELMKYMREKEERLGYQYVSTPVLTQEELYKRSGHAEHYLDHMYATQPDEDGNTFYIKPMNCPHHHMIFEKIVRSYRDLPLRLAEHAGLYRYELSGTLTGLIRMRGPITQNDSHTYVTPGQVEAEFTKLLNLFHEVYKQMGIKDYWFRLSLPDFSKHKYSGERDKWEWAAEAIRKCLVSTKSKFVEVPDEAAFYGPKMDVQIKNVNGKEDSIATIQLDIVVPARMGLSYVDSNGENQTPLVIHTAIMGAFERFMAFLLEQTTGKLPIWLSPEQLRVIALNDSNDILKMAQTVVENANALGIRAKIDSSNESVSKKIRSGEVLKIPYLIVVGEQEVATGKITPRVRSDLPKLKTESTKVSDFLAALSQSIKDRK